MEPAENFGEEKKRMEIKINVVGLLIYSSDEEFFEENIHGCWRTRASGVSDPVPRNKIVCYESCSTSFFFFYTSSTLGICLLCLETGFKEELIGKYLIVSEVFGIMHRQDGVILQNIILYRHG